MKVPDIASVLVPAVAAFLMAGCGGASPTADVPDASDADATFDAADESSDLPARDAGNDDAGCLTGAWTCSDDARTLRTCADGVWTETDCAAGYGRLCENGGCVEPWLYGNPQWGQCPDETRGTPETLAEKAARFEDVMWRIHYSPAIGFILGVTLKHHEVDCQDGVAGPCFEPDVPEDQATWQDVEEWHGHENEGGEAIQYGASLAYRYAVTRSPEALERLKAVLQSEVDRMKITGVPGLFTREMVPPGVSGLACPTDDASYTVDPDKTDNMWVKVGDDGCIRVVDDVTHAWKTTAHCGLAAYAGWCWLDNVSQDEYATHMNSLAVIAKVVDDPEVHATVSDIIEQVGVHLMNNNLTLVDWDGRETEHGGLYATSLKNAPGFLAIMAMDFVLMAADVSGRQDLRTFYEDCLLQMSGQNVCLPWPMEQEPKAYTEWMKDPTLYVGAEGCSSNYNNLSMAVASLDSLLWFERNPEVRSVAQGVLDTQVMRPADQVMALIRDRNPWWNFTWAAHKKLGPGSDGPAYRAVEDSICSLKQFPASKRQRAIDNGATWEEFCPGRLGAALAADPIPVAERCMSNFIWWDDPHEIRTCGEASWILYPPIDYLLAYWSGRYFGFIPDGL